MSNVRNILFVFVVGFLSTTLHAQTTTKEPTVVGKTALKPMTMEDVSKLQESFKHAQHIKVDFDMVQSRKLRKTPIKKQGTAQFAKPNMFLWNLETAPQSIQIFDGKTFTRYSPEKQEAQIFSAKGEEFRSVARLIDMVLDFGALLKDYNIVSKNWQDSMAKLVLRPKAGDSDIREVELAVSSQFSFVRNIKMHFHSGNTTEITFKNLARQKLDPKVFAFHVPKGVKVIDIK